MKFETVLCTTWTIIEANRFELLERKKKTEIEFQKVSADTRERMDVSLILPNVVR